MAAPLTDEDLVERGAIDGRVAFAMATFAALAGLVALLDRIGVPEPLVRLLGPLCVLAGFATIGVLLRSMRVSRFYAAGRAVPTPYVGLATAAVGGGLMLPFSPPAAGFVSGAALGAGLAAGIGIAVLITGPYLRKTGAFSLSDLISSRFPNVALRLGLAVTIAAVGGLVGLSGYETAITPLTEILGIDRAVAAAVIAFVLVLVAAPGGLSGVVWAATGAAGVFLAAFALPLVSLLWRGDIPTPLVEDSTAWVEAGRQIAAWHGEATSKGGFFAPIAAALGLGALAPLLCPQISSRDRDSSWRGGLVALGWGSVMTGLVVAAVFWGAAAFSRDVTGQRPDRLPDQVYAASASGLVSICGASAAGPAQARKACAGKIDATGVLSSTDAKPLGPLFLIGLSASAGLGAAGTGLLAAAILAVGMVVAAAGFLTCSTAIGHDLFYRVRDSSAQTSRRLAVTRSVLVAVVAIGAALTGARELDPRQMAGLAITLSAAGVAPLVVLSIWPRAVGSDAVISLLAGLGSAELILFSGVPSLNVLAAAAVAGAIAGTAAGIGASFLHPDNQEESHAFVESVLHGDGDVFAPDKGA